MTEDQLQARLAAYERVLLLLLLDRIQGPLPLGDPKIAVRFEGVSRALKAPYLDVRDADGVRPEILAELDALLSRLRADLGLPVAPPRR